MQGNSSGFEWNEITIHKLRALWDEGLSTAEIGRRLGASKNAVVGKAHRLDLPERPSPIRRNGTPKPRRPPPPPPRLPLLPSLAASPTVTATASVPTPAPARHALPAAPAPIRSLGTLVAPCSWPIGNPRTAGFRFCEADSVPGRPYCDEHCRDAYVRKRTAA